MRLVRSYTQAEIHQRLTRTANAIAESAGASANVEIDIGLPPTVNDAALVASMREVLTSAMGADRVIEIPRQTASEDFSYFANEVPGLAMILGVTPHDVAPGTAAPNHSPDFFVDESALVTGVEAMLNVTASYLGAY